MVQPPWLLYSEGVADVLVAVIAAVETAPTIHHCDMRGNNMERDTWDELHELLEERKNGAYELHALHCSEYVAAQTTRHCAGKPSSHSKPAPSKTRAARCRTRQSEVQDAHAHTMNCDLLSNL